MINDIILDKLKECFKEDFCQWLWMSNCIDMVNLRENQLPKPNMSEKLLFNYTKKQIETGQLHRILTVLVDEPCADYFWYTYPERGGELTWSLPNHDVVPSDALRVDSEKLKILLRDIKLNQILND